MESELVSLQRRVAELEAALAIVAKRTDPTNLRRRVAPAQLMCAGVVLLCVGILLGGGAGSLVTAQSGPSKVVAPFSVVDSAGRELFRVASASGNGVAFVYGNGGYAQVVLGSPIGSGKAQIQVLSPGGALQAGIGSRASEGDGAIQLWGSKAKAGVVIGGRGQMNMYNGKFTRVVSLEVSDPGDAGNLHLYDNTGNEQVTVGSPPPGSGRPHIQVLSSNGCSGRSRRESAQGRQGPDKFVAYRARPTASTQYARQEGRFSGS